MDEQVHLKRAWRICGNQTNYGWGDNKKFEVIHSKKNSKRRICFSNWTWLKLMIKANGHSYKNSSLSWGNFLPPQYHLYFLDDIALMGAAKIKVANKIKQTLDIYLVARDSILMKKILRSFSSTPFLLFNIKFLIFLDFKLEFSPWYI